MTSSTKPDLVEQVAAAKRDAESNYHSRLSFDRTCVEITKYGRTFEDGTDEVIVIKRYPSDKHPTNAKTDFVVETMIRATLEYARDNEEWPAYEAAIYAMRDAFRTTRRSSVSGMTIDAQFRAEYAVERAMLSAALSALLLEIDQGGDDGLR